MAPPKDREDRGWGFWAERGPLGLANFRRQLGRSDELGDPEPANKTRAILVETGATQKGNARAEGDAASSALTITCTYEGLNEKNAERPLQIRGLVEWGADGHQARAYFDWLHGTTIRIAGSFVRVIAEIEENATPADVADDQLVPTYNREALVRVGAFVGYVPIGGARRPTFTTQVLLAAGAPLIIPAPSFAVGLTIYGPALTDAAWLLGPDVALAFAPIATPPAVPSSPIAYPLPGPATHVAISSAAAGLQTLVWELAL